ncbi:MAG: hypothetical protein ACK4XK_09385 [Casimicrobiaceae bacterium]
MKERGILFSAPMVRALLAGTKTQTRRLVKPPPTHFVGGPGVIDSHGKPVPRAPAIDDGVLSREIVCPYGAPGDKLWVREAWAVPHRYDHLGPSNIPVEGVSLHYAATEERGGLRWRPSIHMCRWASRITLEITGVRVERLQDISEADAQAEGCALACMAPTGDDSGSAIYGPGGYMALWESLNGAGSWDANPWVWVLSFRRV